MSTVVVVGSQWGDEGKGKIVDLLTEHADVVARYQGGHNAGHTVINDKGRFILHLVPSGAFAAHKQLVIGNGVVISPSDLIAEIDALEKRSIRLTGRLAISNAAHVIMPWHVIIDQGREAHGGTTKIGTTGRGIGPAYTAKMDRTGIRMGDLYDASLLEAKVKGVLDEVNVTMVSRYATPPLVVEEVCKVYRAYGERLAEYVTDTVAVVQEAVAAGRNLLVEGAQGTHLDIDHGTYPFVTSSNCTAGGACTGLGLGPTQIDAVVGIVKAYTTRVGEGPFPTELHDEIGVRLQTTGSEFGATTGRTRRCGWFDAVLVRRSAQVNGLTSLAITKLDVLDGLETIRICTGYQVDGKALAIFPTQGKLFAACKPIYEELAGWESSTHGVTEMAKLPKQARGYLKEIERLVRVPIGLVATGPERDSTIVNDLPF
ncbi:MAG: adenylosuccinate synthase [Nitrospirae bacterium CG18_big_fil_WC_8_21_14_2_50_70_55]|nr:adenylosuccinate synthase [Deltaproteobacteria bacterium]OIP65931.1 MAG: adenylosuccinate synthase [Nitrospirae bacterium CG2_30_70_394]PIQ03596.1 MAG: adenylosuccinate synthase [Nitrospirae bacterium CG18_big_fil_WC_8_21_14_2_50_70_55]PIU79323.1 MAG: adenylosuccinate synthase [Nitrospirae bacterium CG06_land_8_20_14_3_00_70_43]PIW83363.1 MAG: adenylosuccinate synthase [Nitrospirae bacterium CG_4_8_14_3_um_filter_70_85]PIX83643.1 MAG: adenylosuccinate synthase [Nitrospirae bacterium CG_4_10